MGDPDDRSDATSQLTDELGERLAVLDRLSPGTLPSAPADVAAGMAMSVMARIEDGNPTTALDLLKFLWPPDGQPPLEWWQTHLARLVAGPLAAGLPDDPGVTSATAAKMLGIGHSRVWQLAGTGALQQADNVSGAGPRSGGRGVTLRSVLARIAANPGTGRLGWSDEALARHRAASDPTP